MSVCVGGCGCVGVSVCIFVHLRVSACVWLHFCIYLCLWVWLSLCAQVSILLCFILYLQSVKFHSIGLCVLIRLIQSSCLNESLCGCFSIGEAFSHLKFTSGSVCLVLVCDSSHFRFSLSPSVTLALLSLPFFYLSLSLLYKICIFSLSHYVFTSISFSLWVRAFLMVYVLLYQSLSPCLAAFLFPFLFSISTLSQLFLFSIPSSTFLHPIFFVSTFSGFFFFFVGLTGSWTNVLVFAPSNFCFKWNFLLPLGFSFQCRLFATNVSWAEIVLVSENVPTQNSRNSFHQA